MNARLQIIMPPFGRALPDRWRTTSCRQAPQRLDLIVEGIIKPGSPSDQADKGRAVEKRASPPRGQI